MEGHALPAVGLHQIWVYSEPGLGTTFKIYLPRAAGAVDEAPPDPISSATRGNETVPLIDDDDQVRGVARNILRRNG